MNFIKFIKPGLFAVIILEIISIFVMLYIHNKFVSDPQNYLSLAVVARQEKKVKAGEKLVIPAQASGTIKSLPKSFLIKNMAFTTQSPDAAWDLVAEESCEEASMIMVDHYWTKRPLNKEIALNELKKLVDFEIETYGDFGDEDSEQIARRLRDYFGYEKVEIVYDFSLEELKRKIIEGRPIIVPAAGRLLKNPNFKQPGPLYHNLVVIGYTESEIITNDPGTRKGEGYRYNQNIFYNAIHDFPGSKELIEQGRKAMVIVKN